MEYDGKKNRNSAGEIPKLKERRIVSWSQEEDDILREQIRIHGTENWSIIASKFKDKTTRQCRRRWYTYLNSDFKKGGWSPEEDALLCEAQRMFGNKWTEIAKVVSGRTDNAVKNRFTTLCKKKAKSDAMAKENHSSYINPNNKRVNGQNELATICRSQTTPLSKKARRSHVSNPSESSKVTDVLPYGTPTDQQIRFPFAVLEHNLVNLPSYHHANSNQENFKDAAEVNKVEGTFLRKDDPRISALLQQAELLSSLAIKVNTENTDQSLENAWKVLQDFLNQNKGTDMLGFDISDMDFQLENFKDLIEDIRSSNEGSHSSWRPPDLEEDSVASSEYSTGSTYNPETAPDRAEQGQNEHCTIHKDNMADSQLTHIEDQPCITDSELLMHSGQTTIQDILPSCADFTNNNGVICAFPSKEFSSPHQVTPMFGTLAAGIPSPKFSESERQFLLKTLGIESPSCNPSNIISKPPPCKRALLQSL